MSFHLGFFEGDYLPIGGDSLGSAAEAWNEMGDQILDLGGGQEGLFNGNIALMLTDLALPATNFGEQHGYAYQYDQVQRIRQGASYRHHAGNWSRPGPFLPGWYDVVYDYDRNGNLTRLNRAKPDSLTVVAMDILQYRYDSTAGHLTNNQLRLVTDQIASSAHDNDIDNQGGVYDKPFSGRNYTYDEIGNLIADSTEHIDTIIWDLGNKILAVRRTPAGKTAGLADLEFKYDAMGHRVFKRVITATGDTTDSWYVRDAAGSPMAVYDQSRSSGGDSILTVLREHTIYGAERLGLDVREELIGVEKNELPLGDEVDPNWMLRALMVTELVYDTPTSPDSVGCEAEVHDGEYIVLKNTTDRSLDPTGFALVTDRGDILALDSFGVIAPGGRVAVGYTAGSSDVFADYMLLPAELPVWKHADLALVDEGDVLRVVFEDSLVVDALAFGPEYGRTAENAYLSATMVDSLADRSSLTSVQRRRYFTGSVDPLADDGVVIDFADPYLEPLPVPDFNVGRFTLARGRKAYELSNHLGNVLAVVGDYKVRGSVEIGTDQFGNPVEAALYEPFVWSMTDYYPFGMEMPERRYNAGDYRYGFNGQEGDDEHLGSGNSYAFRYRVHDARIGRFLSVDPLEGEYPWNSTNAFAENRVIDGIDLEGREYQSSTAEQSYESGNGNVYNDVKIFADDFQSLKTEIPLTRDQMVPSFPSESNFLPDLRIEKDRIYRQKISLEHLIGQQIAYEEWKEQESQKMEKTSSIDGSVAAVAATLGYINYKVNPVLNRYRPLNVLGYSARDISMVNSIPVSFNIRKYGLVGSISGGIAVEVNPKTLQRLGNIANKGGLLLGTYSMFSSGTQFYGAYSDTEGLTTQEAVYHSLDFGSATYGTFGGPYGWAWGTGWEAGRAISQTKWYQGWRNERAIPWLNKQLGYTR